MGESSDGGTEESTEEASEGKVLPSREVANPLWTDLYAGLFSLAETLVGLWFTAVMIPRIMSSSTRFFQRHLFSGSRNHRSRALEGVMLLRLRRKRKAEASSRQSSSRSEQVGLVSRVRDRLSQALSFSRPSPTALALSASERREAEKLVSNLSPYELTLAADLVDTDALETGFDSLGGLGDVVDKLKAAVILPLQRPDLFAGALLSPCKGVLLYGPPGTGKTTLARALARASGAAFLSVQGSTLTSMWLGESEKIIKGLFSLARRLAPSIIFLDEADAFMRERKEFDHSHTATIKAEFMAEWEGLATNQSIPVIVVGATNVSLTSHLLLRFLFSSRFPGFVEAMGR